VAREEAALRHRAWPLAARAEAALRRRASLSAATAEEELPHPTSPSEATVEGARRRQAMPADYLFAMDESEERGNCGETAKQTH